MSAKEIAYKAIYKLSLEIYSVQKRKKAFNTNWFILFME